MNHIQSEEPKLFLRTGHGEIYQGNSLVLMPEIADSSIDLIVTSPPFGLVRKKEYGNVPADEYLEWFRPFARQFQRVLKDSGSLVIDIGGTWNQGEPTRHLYHFELLVMLCKEIGFHLAQDFYWWNPAKLPTPAEWVTIRRIRVKDAVNKVWWLSKTPWPKADNRRVLQPYSESMEELLRSGYKPRLRPSGHDISDRFSIDNGASIPSNLLASANTDSNGNYLRYCRKHDLRPHPARFPQQVPEFFIRMLTDPGDQVLDPFAGSCITGEVAEHLERKWTCVELDDKYLLGAVGRFGPNPSVRKTSSKSRAHYLVPKLGSGWTATEEEPIRPDGGRLFRRVKRNE